MRLRAGQERRNIERRESCAIQNNTIQIREINETPLRMPKPRGVLIFVDGSTNRGDPASFFYRRSNARGWHDICC
jgi:hypothetical protein